MNARQAWLVLVLAAAIVFAGLHYWQFLQNPRPRWNGLVHDRSSHYEFAQTMAIAVRHADPVAFFSTLEKAKVWPPLHGLCAAAILAIGGIDYRLAVVPSLIGWVGTIVFGFLLARRISGSHGNAAGVIAATMILASPALRIYAVDIMLESLGAALTIAALYFYVVAKQEPSTRVWRWLAITLTLLFFEKYNYWLLLVLAFVGAEILGWRATEWRRALETCRRFDWKRFLRAEVREPLNWIFALLVTSTIAIFLAKPQPIPIGGTMVSLYPPNNFVTFAYGALFFRLLKANIFTRWTAPAPRQLMIWHALPLALSFLLPRRLSAVAWYLGPLNRGENASPPSLQTMGRCLQSLVTDYHMVLWSALGAALFFGLALITYRRLRAGGIAVLLLVLISAALTLIHPNQKSRFLHSWSPVFWVVGAAGLVGCLNDRRLGRALAYGAAAGVVLVHSPELPKVGHGPETGCRGEKSSLLDITDTYLSEVGDKRGLAVFSTVTSTGFLTWTYHERHPVDAIELPLKDYPLSREAVRRRLEKWETETHADAAVFLDFAPGSPNYRMLSDYESFRDVEAMMNASPHFHFSRQWELPEHGCRVSLWLRN